MKPQVFAAEHALAAKKMASEMLSELRRLYDGQNGYVRFYVSARSRLLRLDHYLEFLPHRGLIIDMGCGYGVLANYLSLCLPHARIVGIDLNKKRIDAARKTIGIRSGIDFLVEDAVQSVLPRCTGIAMTDFLHHIAPTDQEVVLDRAFQSLETDGVLLISEVNTDARPFYRYWASYLSDRVLYPLSKSFFRSGSAWSDALLRLGFSVRIVDLPNPVFGGIALVCRKQSTSSVGE